MFFFFHHFHPLEARAGLVMEGAFPGKAAIVCKDQGEPRSFPVDPKDTALVPWIAPVKTLCCFHPKLAVSGTFAAFLLDIGQSKNHKYIYIYININFLLLVLAAKQCHQILEIPDKNSIELEFYPRSWLICSLISWSQLVVWVSIIQISHQPHGRDICKEPVVWGARFPGQNAWHNHTQSRKK